MKTKTEVVSIVTSLPLFLLFLLLLQPMAASASSSSASYWGHGYHDYVSVSGTISGGSVSSFSYDDTASCDPNNSNSTCPRGTGYIAFYGIEEYESSGVWTCVFPSSGSCTDVWDSGHTWSLSFTWGPSSGISASEVYTEGKVGYTTDGITFTPETPLIDAGLPAN